MTTTPPAPTLTAATDADPCPRVEIEITPMPVDADSITIWRSWAGKRDVVRGVNNTEVAGDYLVTDYEVPLGIAVTYTCVTKDAAGVPSAVSAGSTVTLAVPDVWLQDPLDPGSALSARTTRGSMTAGLEFIGESFLPAVYPSTSSISPVAGSDLPIGFGGARGAASRMPIAIIAWSASDAGALRELDRQAYPMCVRPPANVVPQLGGLVYMHWGDLSEVPYPGWGATLFGCSADAVRGPATSVVVQTRTFDDLLTEAATFDDLLTLYATFTDLQRGP